MKLARLFLGGAAVFLVAGAATAETAPFRLQVALSSSAGGLGEGSFRLYERQSGRGRDARVQAVLTRFESPVGAVKTAAIDSVQTGDDHVLVNGDGWLLDVRGEGDWIRYWNLKYTEGPDNTPLPLSEKPSLARLESIGRKFIASALGDVVHLASNEGLQPWYTSHQISVEEDIGGKRVQRIYASKIVFTRTIDDVPVLGPGSKVVVHIAADGTPTGFDVDWSRFTALSTTQKALPLNEIRERAERLATEKAPAASRAEERFECGYYDTGARRANRAAPLQVACLSSYRVAEASGDGAHGLVDAVPASAAVQLDAQWIESASFAK